MAISTSDLLYKLNPLAPIDASGLTDVLAKREQLAQMRAQLEETMRRNKADEELRRMTEEGERARAAMTDAQKRAERQAAVAAKQKEDKLAAWTKFDEANAAGQIEAGRGMMPRMLALGMDAEELGSADGLPSYRIGLDRQQAEAEETVRSVQASPYGPGETSEQSLDRLGALGYPGNDSGVMNPPPGIGSTQDAFGQALAASQAARDAGGLPARAPDAEDFTGGVPQNVTDLGAIHAQTLNRLNPALSGLIGAYPEEFRASAEQTAAGVRGLGLPATEAVKQFDALRGGGPDSLWAAKIAAREKKEQKDELTPVQAEQLKGEGFNRAEHAYKNNDIPAAVDAMAAADTVMELLTNDDTYDDEKVVNYLMKMTGNKGPQTEADALRVVGRGEISTIDQFRDYLHKKAIGGFSDELRESIASFVEGEREKDRLRAFDYIDRMEAQSGDPETHERTRRGYKQFTEGTIPGWLLDEYRDTKEIERAEKEATDGADSTDVEPMAGHEDLSTMNDFDLELEGVALENDLDPTKMRAVIGPESGGRGDAVNPRSGATGIIQFMPSSAASVGTSTEALRGMSAAEQLPYAVKYFKDRGISADSRAEDYALAVAAPAFIGKSDDAVVYRKGTRAWEDNAPWRPADGGDITVGDILKFYGLRDGAKKAEAPASAVDAEVLDILREP